jgi:hypothetical protein
MIINHSDLIGITIDPFKDHAPLIVDATSTGLSSDECHACSPTNILASLCTCRFAWTCHNNLQKMNGTIFVKQLFYFLFHLDRRILKTEMNRSSLFGEHAMNRSATMSRCDVELTVLSAGFFKNYVNRNLFDDPEIVRLRPRPQRRLVINEPDLIPPAWEWKPFIGCFAASRSSGSIGTRRLCGDKWRKRCSFLMHARSVRLPLACRRVDRTINWFVLIIS